MRVSEGCHCFVASSEFFTLDSEPESLSRLNMVSLQFENEAHPPPGLQRQRKGKNYESWPCCRTYNTNNPVHTYVPSSLCAPPQFRTCLKIVNQAFQYVVPTVDGWVGSNQDPYYFTDVGNMLAVYSQHLRSIHMRVFLTEEFPFERP